VSDAVEFHREDYHDLSELNPGSFDVVWTIESLMHTDRVESPLTEFTNLLADGGRLVVCEPFQAGSVSPTSRTLLERLEDGNEAAIDDIDQFTTTLREIGFDSVEQRDITDEVAPGITKRAKIARWILRPAARIGSLIGVVDREVVDALSAAAASGRLFGNRVLCYRVVSARYTDV
jgi:Methyltransferase domain.